MKKFALIELLNLDVYCKMKKFALIELLKACLNYIDNHIINEIFVPRNFKIKILRAERTAARP